MALVPGINNVLIRIGTEFKAHRGLINGGLTDLSTLSTTDKTNLVAAINEVKGVADSALGGGVSINDAATNTTQTWSSSKISSSLPTWSTISGKPAVVAEGATQAAARAAIGATDLVIGTTGTTAAAGNRTASETATGMVELATTAEATTGTDTSRAVTPAGLKAVADTKAASSHTHLAANISDSSVVGRNVLTAVDAAAARAAIGAGTGNSNLVIGTGAGTAAEGNRVATETSTGMIELATTTEATTGTDTSRAVTPAGLKAVADTKANTSHTHTASQISDATATGRSVLQATDAAAARTAIGAGTSSLVIGTGAGTAAEGNRAASLTAIGMVELATTAETTTGTDTTRAVTPAGVKAVADTLAPLSHSHNAANITDFASAVDARIANVISSAPAALDTLDELAAALGDDPNFAATMTTALGNRVRVDAVQSFTAPQMLQARSNIGAVAAADVGDTETNFVTAFELALV